MKEKLEIKTDNIILPNLDSLKDNSFNAIRLFCCLIVIICIVVVWIIIKKRNTNKKQDLKQTIVDSTV